jgi:hypothetical protein
MFIQASFMQSLPGNHFFIYTRGGNCHGIAPDMSVTTFSQNTNIHPAIEAWRPFSKAIELFDPKNELKTGGDCAIIASVV